MRAISSLDAGTLDALKDLARANVDSSMSLDEAARSVQDVDLSRLFFHIALRRRRNVEALSTYVQVNDSEFEVRGSLRGALHRWWLHLRAATQHENARAVIAEAERSEDAIRATYEKILVRLAGTALYDVLHSQYREVKQNHDRIREMRERIAAARG